MNLHLLLFQETLFENRDLHFKYTDRTSTIYGCEAHRALSAPG